MIYNTEGYDICCICGKSFKYRTLKDKDDTFNLYCSKCRPDLYKEMNDVCHSCGKPLTKAVWKENVWFCTNKKCGHYGLGINELGEDIR